MKECKEYKVTDIDQHEKGAPSATQDHLNEHAREGWRLISAMPLQNDFVRLIWERDIYGSGQPKNS